MIEIETYDKLLADYGNALVEIERLKQRIAELESENQRLSDNILAFAAFALGQDDAEWEA